MYADDLTIIMQYSEEELRAVVKILDQFYKLLGLQIHLNKTQCVKLGPNPAGMPRLCPDIPISWDQKFRLLGVDINTDTLDYTPNLDEKLKEIDNVIGNWKHRFLTPLGRACVAKTLLLSKLNHLAFILPDINKNVIKKIETKLYEFIWGESAKVAKTDTKLEWMRGGDEPT